jgi:hypothetical protein
VGSAAAIIAHIIEGFRAIPRPPFDEGPDTRRATWLEPRLKIEVSYNEMMEGRLRDPVLRRLLPTR